MTTPPKTRVPLSAGPVGQIILNTWIALTLFAIAHDQVTAHLCPEYFTVAHPDNGFPRLFHHPSPTVLGVVWGTAASIGPGLLAGILLALAAQAGRAPRFSPRTVLLATLPLLAAMALAATLAGGVGYQSETLPALRPFTAALYAHRATYATGIAGALLLAAILFFSRRARPNRPI